MTDPHPPFTPDQLDALRDLIADAVHEAVAPIARQTTQWLMQERARLADPRRTATGRPARRAPGRLVPDHERNLPPIGDPTTPGTPASGVRE